MWPQRVPYNYSWLSRGRPSLWKVWASGPVVLSAVVEKQCSRMWSHHTWMEAAEGNFTLTWHSECKLWNLLQARTQEIKHVPAAPCVLSCRHTCRVSMNCQWMVIIPPRTCAHTIMDLRLEKAFGWCYWFYTLAVSCLDAAENILCKRKQTQTIYHYGCSTHAVLSSLNSDLTQASSL